MNSLVWFRNDLRVEDNTSLLEACKQSGKVIGVYCFDPRHFLPTTYGFRKTEKYRAKFLIECVTELKKDLLVLEELPEMHTRLEESIRQGELDKIRSSAHALKGSLANIFASHASELAIALEEFVKVAERSNTT